MLELAKKYKVSLHPQFYEGNNIFALRQGDNRLMKDYSDYYQEHKEKLVPMVKKMWAMKKRYWHLFELKEKG